MFGFLIFQLVKTDSFPDFDINLQSNIELLSVNETNSTCPFFAYGCSIYHNITSDGIYQSQEYYNISFESQCFLNFTGCIVGGCYSIFDTTSQFKIGYAPGISNSIFNEINISGARFRQFSSGISIVPTQTDFWLNFSIKRSQDFYSIHPFQPYENVNQYEISSLLYGFPVCYGV